MGKNHSFLQLLTTMEIKPRFVCLDTTCEHQHEHFGLEACSDVASTRVRGSMSMRASSSTSTCSKVPCFNSSHLISSELLPNSMTSILVRKCPCPPFSLPSPAAHRGTEATKGFRTRLRSRYSTRSCSMERKIQSNAIHCPNSQSMYDPKTQGSGRPTDRCLPYTSQDPKKYPTSFHRHLISTLSPHSHSQHQGH
jgi:hypothetical protein